MAAVGLLTTQLLHRDFIARAPSPAAAGPWTVRIEAERNYA
jgi:hypothetical protein